MAKATRKTAKKAVKKATGGTAKRSRPAGQRDLVRHGSRSAYAKRTETGEFTELDDVGRSQKADRPVEAKRVAKSGFGDQGDRPRRTAKKR